MALDEQVFETLTTLAVLCLPGSHDYTDTMSSEGQPRYLYCRKCADVQPLEPADPQPPTMED